MQTPHAALKDAIRLKLGTRPDVLVLNNAGGYDETKKIRYGLGKGSHDLVCVLAPWGRWFCIEVKTGTGRPRPEQKRWHELMGRFGAYTCVCWSVEEAEEHLEKARKECESWRS